MAQEESAQDAADRAHREEKAREAVRDIQEDPAVAKLTADEIRAELLPLRLAPVCNESRIRVLADSLKLRGARAVLGTQVDTQATRGNR